jgi:acyl-CoA thioester hydrolase
MSAFDVANLPMTHEALIPASYLDSMGHMNVMWYTHLFSNATLRFFELVGLTRAYFESRQCGSFALEVHVRYLAELHQGDSASIHTRAVARSEKRLHYLHFMQKQADGKTAAICETVSAHIDMKLRRMAPLPPEIAAAFDRFQAAHAALAWPPPLCGAMRA